MQSSQTTTTHDSNICWYICIQAKYYRVTCVFVHHVFILILSSIKALSTVKSDLLSVDNFIWPKKSLLSILIACIKTNIVLVICQQESSFV